MCFPKMARSKQNVAVQAAVRDLKGGAEAFVADAHRILGRFETAKSTRILTLDESRKKLVALSLQQDELLNEALSCIEFGLLRAAHVAAWQAFMDFLEQKLASDGLQKLHTAFPKWAQYESIEELRENIPEFQIIEAAKELKLLNKNSTKSLHGHLSTRNDCAHPSSYRPSLSATIGYVADLMDRIEELQKKSL